MIINKLCEQYDRMLEKNPKMPKYGFSPQKITAGIVLDADGNIKEIIPLLDQTEGKSKKLIPRTYLLPVSAIRSTNIAPNFLWDTTKYSLGVTYKKEDKNIEFSENKFNAFKELHKEILKDMEEEDAKILLRFLDNWHPKKFLDFSEEDQNLIIDNNIFFLIDHPLREIHENNEISTAWAIHYKNRLSAENALIGVCSVTGLKDAIPKTHSKIKGVCGSQPSGAGLITYNTEAFLSYNKEQNENSSVGEVAAFKYVAALNKMLEYGSRNTMRLGKTTVVFWSEGTNDIVEGFFNIPINSSKIMEEEEEKINNLLKEAKNGLIYNHVNPDLPFYILGLSPNSSRLSVDYWYQSSAGEIIQNVLKHTLDTELISNWENTKYPTIHRVLYYLIPNEKERKNNTFIMDDIFRSIIRGGNYPINAYVKALNRLKIKIEYTLISFIKAYLTRKKGLRSSYLMKLDTNNNNSGYLAGRLLAVLEKAQRDSVSVNLTLRDRYWALASMNPAKAIPVLLRQANCYLGDKPYLNKIIREILECVDTWPKILSIEDQGMFALGYYHQNTHLYTKKENMEKEKENNDNQQL